ncbi:TetR/AcrR family transcriptional regulator [Nocardiopsis sp. NPDC006198]|uniref:TetR/AcrR family transcriptional regulator n=1 Tax=Nocardiopsis sp. NPDC006198 TaxID=3154472 RepID=UPI0033A0959E
MVRATADERRRAMLAAARHEFAQKGYSGATTQAIAASAGVSQPYVYSLFPNKKALFGAAWESCCDEIESTLTAAAEGLAGEEAVRAMALAYDELIRDRDLLQFQLQAWAAAGQDEELRAAVARRFERLWELVGRAGGTEGEQTADFMATWVLYNVAVSLDLSLTSQCRVSAALDRRSG